MNAQVNETLFTIFRDISDYEDDMGDSKSTQKDDDTKK